MAWLRRYIRRVSLRKKIFIGTAATVSMVLTATGLILYIFLSGYIKSDIQTRLSDGNAAITNLIHTSVTTAIRNHLRAVAEKNKEIVGHFYQQAQQGLLSEAEAKAKAAEVLSSQTIGKTGYIFCLDGNHVMQVHPVKEFIGEDISQFDLSIRQDQVKQGYLEYDWANPDDAEPRAKAMYMAYFEPWDWIISVSSYRDEFMDIIPLDDIRKAVLAYTFGETGYAYIIDTTGKIIVHPRLNISGKAALQIDAKYFKEVLKQRNGTIYYPIKLPGENHYRDKVAIFTELPELGWFVFSSGYLAEFQQTLRVLLHGMIWSILFAIIIIFILTWWLGGIATRPLSTMMKALDKGARGDLSQRLNDNQNDEFGQLARYYNQFMDNLEVSQRNLADSEEKFRVIFEQAVEGLFRSHHTKGLIAVNPAMATILGYSDPKQVLSEITDPEKQMYVDPQDRNRLYELLKKQDMVKGLEIHFKRRDGSTFLGEFSAKAERDENGEIRYTYGIIKDITAQHETMLALTKAKEEAEAASQLKSFFLNVVAHEFRTPMTSILGFSKIVTKQLQNNIEPAVDPSQKDAHKALQRSYDNLGIISTEIKNLGQSLNETFDMFQLESGELSLELTPVDPVKTADRAVQDSTPKAEAKGISVHLEAEEELPPVLADAERIQQVLGHLLDNAIKFSSEGQITVSVTKRDNSVEFAVHDTGLGIPAESLKNIFASFTQHGGSLTDKPKGLGLGLAISQCIVTLHSGSIQVDSTPGQGSTFSFTLSAVEN